MNGLPPSPFISSAFVAETLPVMASGTEHPMAGSFSIDEDSFFYATNPPPLPDEHIEAVEIETILRAIQQVA